MVDGSDDGADLDGWWHGLGLGLCDYFAHIVVPHEGGDDMVSMIGVRWGENGDGELIFSACGDDFVGAVGEEDVSWDGWDALGGIGDFEADVGEILCDLEGSAWGWALLVWFIGNEILIPLEYAGDFLWGW